MTFQRVVGHFTRVDVWQSYSTGAVRIVMYKCCWIACMGRNQQGKKSSHIYQEIMFVSISEEYFSISNDQLGVKWNDTGREHKQNGKFYWCLRKHVEKTISLSYSNGLCDFYIRLIYTNLRSTVMK